MASKSVGKIRLEVEVVHESEDVGGGHVYRRLHITSAQAVGMECGALASPLSGIEPEHLTMLADDIDADGRLVDAIIKALREEFAVSPEGGTDDNDN